MPRRLVALVGAVAALVAACGPLAGGDATGPSSRLAPARVALATTLSLSKQTAAEPLRLRARASYLRSGESGPALLADQTFTLSDAPTQQLPLTVDLAACLNDPAHQGVDGGTGPDAGCAATLELTLLSGDRVLDVRVISPLVLKPGATTGTGGASVTLYEVARVAVTAAGSVASPARVELGQQLALAAAVTDADSRPLADRPVVWTSDNPGVASVDSVTGVVTSRTVGRARITGTAGGRTGTFDVNVVPASAAVTVTVASGAGTGRVTSAPAGIDCQVTAGVSSGTCAATLPGDVPIVLTATPAVGSSFTTWGGACATADGALACTLQPFAGASAPRATTVAFTAFRALDVTLTGAGVGTVTSTPAGISCTRSGGATSGTCSTPYLEATAVTLTAAPSAASTFSGWSGACTGTAACTVTLDQARSVTAGFARRQVTLTVGIAGSGAGTVAATGAGVLSNGRCALAAGQGSTSCAIPVEVGSSVTLTATADTASSFGGFGGPCTTSPCTVTIADNVSVPASFTLRPVALTVIAGAGNAGAGTVTTADSAISCGIGGSTANGRCAASIPVGTTVTLTATPSAQQRFLGWGGDCASALSAPTCTLDVRVGTTVSVRFAPPQTLTVTLTGAADGTVSSNPAGISCVRSGGTTTGTCAASYPNATTVTLVAAPTSASTFTGWSGACTGTGSCTVTLDQARAVTAGFARRQVTLTVGISGSGSGSVTVTGSGVLGNGRCILAARQGSTSCAVPVEVGTSVTLTATADSTSNFGGFGSPCTTSPCTFTIADDASVPASFTLRPVPLTVVAGASNAGAGTVTTADSVIGCGINGSTASGRCSVLYPVGSTVTLTATPPTQQRFLGWGGDCASALTAPTCTLDIRVSTTVSARFAPPQTLTVTPAGTGAGTVSGGAIACSYASGSPSGTCTTTQPYGTVVTLTATPNAASVFGGWTGACTGTGSCTVTLDQARAVGATFTVNTARINVRGTAGYSGSGSITSPVGISCEVDFNGASTGSCAADVVIGQTITLTANPSNSAFTPRAWTAPCPSSSTTSCTFTVPSGGANVEVGFAQAVQVTVSAPGTGNILVSVPGVADRTCTFGPGTPPNDCIYGILEGEQAMFTANPDLTGGFRGWSTNATNPCRTTGSARICSTTIPIGVANQGVFATFDNTVAVQLGGPGAGTVASTGLTGPNTSCGRTTGATDVNCSLRVPAQGNSGLVVSLDAAAGTNSVIGSWQNPASCGSASRCSFQVQDLVGAARVTFNLATTSYNIRPAASNVYGGEVRFANGTNTYSCIVASGFSGQCSSLPATVGQTVTFDAYPSDTAVFTGWSGVCSGTTLNCSLTAALAGGTANASFAAATTLVLTMTTVEGPASTSSAVVAATGRRDTTFTLNGGGTTKNVVYRRGVGTVTFSPGNRANFAGWDGACAGTNVNANCVLTNYAGAAGVTMYFYPN